MWKARMGQLLINFLSLSVADLRGEEVRVAPISPATRSPSASPLGGPNTTDASGCWFWSMVEWLRVAFALSDCPRLESPLALGFLYCAQHTTLRAHANRWVEPAQNLDEVMVNYDGFLDLTPTQVRTG